MALIFSVLNKALVQMALKFLYWRRFSVSFRFSVMEIVLVLICPSILCAREGSSTMPLHSCAGGFGTNVFLFSVLNKKNTNNPDILCAVECPLLITLIFFVLEKVLVLMTLHSLFSRRL